MFTVGKPADKNTLKYAKERKLVSKAVGYWEGIERICVDSMSRIEENKRFDEIATIKTNFDNPRKLCAAKIWTYTVYVLADGRAARLVGGDAGRLLDSSRRCYPLPPPPPNKVRSLWIDKPTQNSFPWYLIAPEYTGPRIGQWCVIMIQLMYVVHNWTVDYCI